MPVLIKDHSSINTGINEQRLLINKHSMSPCPKGSSQNLRTCHGPNYEWQKHVLKKHHQNFSRKGHIPVRRKNPDYPQWKAVKKEAGGKLKGPILFT